MRALRIDVDGYYVEDVILSEGDETPYDCVSVEPNQNTGFYKLKFNRDTNTWEEGLTVEEIQALQSLYSIPTIEELQAQINTLQAQVDEMIVAELMGGM